LDQQLVTGVVAEGVVDQFEPVQVEVEQREHAGTPGQPGASMVQALHEQRSVAQARQRVSEDLVGHLRFEPLAFGRVTGDLAVAAEPPVVVDDGGEDHVGPEARAVPADPPPLVLDMSGGGGIRQVAGEFGTAAIFATYPQSFLSTVGGFVDQVVGTALLMAVILAITDQRNNATPSWLTPIIVGAIVVAVGVSFGFNAGYAINPARDLGPRLFTFVAGWGSGVFTAAQQWWWVPVVAPCVGAVIGALTYDLLVSRHHPTTTVEVL